MGQPLLDLPAAVNPPRQWLSDCEHEAVLFDSRMKRIVMCWVVAALHGGVRIEDMVLLTASGHEVLAPLHEGWEWKD